MIAKTRMSLGLGTALLAGAALLAVTPGATAATTTASAGAATSQAQTSTLAPPTLTSVTKNGDNMIVIWKPSSSQGVKDYVLLANGRFVERMFPGTPTDPPEDKWFVAVASEGLTGTETYTVAAEDSAGNLSAPSNSMKAAPPVTLTPTPQMVSAVVKGDQIMLKWTASHTDEASGYLWYGFFVNGKQYKKGTPPNVTSVTLPVSDNDPVDPTVFYPGAKVTVEATDYTGLNHSEISNAVTATTG